jgi:beta-carotene 15,15'-dioxygenase
MFKYSNFAIISSFFSLWLCPYFSDKYQLMLGFLFIFTFGILHGANDLVLIKKLNNSKSLISFKKILFYYIVIVLVGITAFYLFPLTALILFIIVSGYHFGEQQWQHLHLINKNIFTIFFQTIYGLIILFLLFNFHKLEVSNIIFEICYFKIPLELISTLLKMLSILFFILILYLYIYVEKLRTQIVLEIFYLMVFTIIFLSSSLIWGFAIFFIIWHSVPSIIDQIKYLYKNVNFHNFKLYFISGFIYWVASLVGIALLYYLFKDEKIFNAIFFSFLAAITFPHAIVILKMFNKK